MFKVIKALTLQRNLHNLTLYVVLKLIKPCNMLYRKPLSDVVGLNCLDVSEF